MNKKSLKFIPVILAGGKGSRLWPLSREGHPKQFFDLFDGDTLFERTLKRMEGLVSVEEILIICGKEQEFYVKDQLSKFSVQASIILEPEPKNTGPSATLGALFLREKYGNVNMFVVPSDHFIEGKEEFKEAVKSGVNLANEGYIATFGINPLEPNTGYGYIQVKKSKEKVKEIIAFKEKPNATKALEYLESGNFFWNSGMFLIQSEVYLKELGRFNPKMISTCSESLSSSKNKENVIDIPLDKFKTCPENSIDYCLMEKTNLGWVIDSKFRWSDVGSWDSFWETAEKDENQNVGSNSAILIDSKNSLIKSDKLVAGIGIKDLVIIDTEDALLVARKNRTQEVKEIVNVLNEGSDETVKLHKKVHRPWGWYHSLSFGEKDQVKRISVNPYQKLSVQRHKHRSEHWVIVKGQACVTLEDSSLDLKENDSIFIKKGKIHAIENKTSESLELIEVQFGEYLGEDDIERLEDIYGRAQ